MTRDAFTFLATVKDEEENGTYCDPPFFGPGDEYRHRFTEAQHVQLRDAMLRFSAARVVIRYYDIPLIRALYPKDSWTWRRMTGRKQSNADAPEVLILNGPSYATEEKGLF